MPNEKWFFNSSAAILVLAGAAKLYSATGTARVLEVQDQMLHLGYRPLMVSAGVVEMAVAALLLTSRSDFKRSLVLLWLSGNFLFYHWGSQLLGFHTCPCLGHLTDRLPLPPGLAEVILQVLALFWFLTSLERLWRDWGSAHWARLLLVSSRILRGPSAHANQG